MAAFLRLFTRRKKKDKSDGAAVYGMPEELGKIKSGSARYRRSDLECKIVFLDGTEATRYIDKKAKGLQLYDYVFKQLDFSQEQDYFGLQYTDTRNISNWLDPTKQVRKQCEIGPPYTLRFQVKFYSSDPHHLRDELTRYFFVLQLRQDIRTGRLVCDEEIGAELSSLCLQGELGDYDEETHTPAFVSAYRFLPDHLQTEDFELSLVEKFCDLRGRGLTPAMTDKIFLEKIRLLEDFGVDMHSVKGKDGSEYLLGLTPTGILIYEGHTKIGLFYWPMILKLEFRKCRLKVVVADQEENAKEVQEHTFVFNLPDTRACKHLWKCAIEHHTFFRLIDPKRPPNKRQQIFRMRSRFYSSFRTEYQMQRVNSFGTSTRRSSSFTRTPSRRYSSRPTFEKAELESKKAQRDRIREEKKTETLQRLKQQSAQEQAQEDEDSSSSSSEPDTPIVGASAQPPKKGVVAQKKPSPPREAVVTKKKSPPPRERVTTKKSPPVDVRTRGVAPSETVEKKCPTNSPTKVKVPVSHHRPPVCPESSSSDSDSDSEVEENNVFVSPPRPPPRASQTRPPQTAPTPLANGDLSLREASERAQAVIKGLEAPGPSKSTVTRDKNLLREESANASPPNNQLKAALVKTVLPPDQMSRNNLKGQSIGDDSDAESMSSSSSDVDRPRTAAKEEKLSNLQLALQMERDSQQTANGLRKSEKSTSSSSSSCSSATSPQPDPQPRPAGSRIPKIAASTHRSSSEEATSPQPLAQPPRKSSIPTLAEAKRSGGAAHVVSPTRPSVPPPRAPVSPSGASAAHTVPPSAAVPEKLPAKKKEIPVIAPPPRRPQFNVETSFDGTQVQNRHIVTQFSAPAASGSHQPKATAGIPRFVSSATVVAKPAVGSSSPTAPVRQTNSMSSAPATRPPGSMLPRPSAGKKPAMVTRVSVTTDI